MANDWAGVDKPEYIPDTETDAGELYSYGLRKGKETYKEGKGGIVQWTRQWRLRENVVGR